MESRSGNVNRAPSKVVIKAPGKAFRAGISLIELFETFPDNATAEAWFTEQRWPDGKPICPHCGHDDVQVGAAHASQRYRCRHRECGRRFSVKIGTVMEGSNIKLQKWAIAIYLDRYVDEFSGRHNIRRDDTIDQMGSVAHGMVGQRLRYRDLIAPNGRPSGARELAR